MGPNPTESSKNSIASLEAWNTILNLATEEEKKRYFRDLSSAETADYGMRMFFIAAAMLSVVPLIVTLADLAVPPHVRLGIWYVLNTVWNIPADGLGGMLVGHAMYDKAYTSLTNQEAKLYEARLVFWYSLIGLIAPTVVATFAHGNYGIFSAGLFSSGALPIVVSAGAFAFAGAMFVAAHVAHRAEKRAEKRSTHVGLLQDRMRKLIAEGESLTESQKQRKRVKYITEILVLMAVYQAGKDAYDNEVREITQQREKHNAEKDFFNKFGFEYDHLQIFGPLKNNLFSGSSKYFQENDKEFLKDLLRHLDKGAEINDGDSAADLAEKCLESLKSYNADGKEIQHLAKALVGRERSKAAMQRQNKKAGIYAGLGFTAGGLFLVCTGLATLGVMTFPPALLTVLAVAAVALLVPAVGIKAQQINNNVTFSKPSAQSGQPAVKKTETRAKQSHTGSGVRTGVVTMFPITQQDDPIAMDPIAYYHDAGHPLSA